MTSAPFRFTACRVRSRACALAVLLLAAAAPAQLLDLEDDGGLGDIELGDIFSEEPDYELLARSHLSVVADWPDVTKKSAAASGEQPAPAWQTAHIEGYNRFAAVMGSNPFPAREFVKPVSGEPIGVDIHVPETGDYRIWLGYAATPSERRPVEMALTGANERTHVFGNTAIPQGQPEELERKYPVRFESGIDAARFGLSGGTAILWEYWDTQLNQGATRLSLRSDSPAARVDSVFVTQSRAFVPRNGMYDPGSTDNEVTLHRVYYRFRFSGNDEAEPPIGVTSFVRYKSPHYRRGNDERLWYSSFLSSSTAPVPGPDNPRGLAPNVWSEWLDETELVTSGGRYGITRMTVKGAETGTLEAQMAWYPHEAAVVKTVALPVHSGQTLMVFPVHPRGYPPPSPDIAGAGTWGMVGTNYIDYLQSEGDALRRVLALMDTEEVVDGPPLRHIKLYTGCGVSAPWYDLAIPALQRVGFNWLGSIPSAVRRKHGLTEDRILYQQGSIVHARIHSPLDPTFEPWVRDWAQSTLASLREDDPDIEARRLYLKMGDEIGPVTSPAHIRDLPDCRAAFREYLAAELEAAGRGPEFFGVRDLAALDFSLDRTPDMGRYARRLYYYSARFEWLLTSRYYEVFTRAAQSVLPNLLTACNYTPGSFMFAGDMRSSNWFALARHGGSNSALAEGWVRPRGRYAFAGTQNISYYAEILDCAAREHELPKWFYLVGGCGEIDRKMMSLVSREIYLLHLYDWGPAYLGGDSFSDAAWTYPQINKGVRALQPFEDLIVQGRRPPRRVALVYNRTDEIWHGGSLGVFIDRLFTFLALQHGHIPVDIVLDTDLTAAKLRQYAAVYLNGINVPRRAVASLREWVEEGGVLCAAAGSAMRDEYDDSIPETAELFGATQRLSGISKSNWYYSQWWPIGLRTHTPIDTVRVQATPLTPEIAADVVGVKASITPTTGSPVATFGDGSCAGVLNELGKGKTLLLGFTPGLLYCHNAPFDWEPPFVHAHPTNYVAERRELITRAAQAALGAPDITCSKPLVEVTRIEHATDGIAVLLTDFTYEPAGDVTISVRTDREVTQVVSALHETVHWQREGDCIVITAPAPAPIDVIALRTTAALPHP